MRRAARIDDNHSAIVAMLRRMGAKVQSLAAVGDGCPDLLVGVDGENYLFEVKDGNKSPSRRRLTSAQLTWHENWRGQVDVLISEKDAEQWMITIRSAGL